MVASSFIAYVLSFFVWVYEVTESVSDQLRMREKQEETDFRIEKDDPRIEEVLTFLIENQPERDANYENNVTKEYLLENVLYALETYEILKEQNLHPPWNIFLNDVAPYAVFTEERTGFRKVFFNKFIYALHETIGTEKFKDKVTQLKSIVHIINRDLWTAFTKDPETDPYYNENPLKFIPASTDAINNYSIDQILLGTYTGGKPGSSCTGLAILMVTVFRAIGIPARAVGTPHWHRGRDECPNGDADELCGNHNWVEVYLGDGTDSNFPEGGGWHFLSPGDGAPIDHGWFSPTPVDFQTPLSGLHSVYATSWKNPKTSWTNPEKETTDIPADRFIMVWNDHHQDLLDNYEVHGWDVTKRYVGCNEATCSL